MTLGEAISVMERCLEAAKRVSLEGEYPTEVAAMERVIEAAKAWAEDARERDSHRQPLIAQLG